MDFASLVLLHFTETPTPSSLSPLPSSFHVGSTTSLEQITGVLEGGETMVCGVSDFKWFLLGSHS